MCIRDRMSGSCTDDVGIEPATGAPESTGIAGLGVAPGCAAMMARDVAENATCVSISCATLVARMSGVAVGAMATAVAVTVGVGGNPKPRCIPSHMRLMPSNTKTVTRMLTVRTAAVRLRSRGEIGR